MAGVKFGAEDQQPDMIDIEDDEIAAAIEKRTN